MQAVKVPQQEDLRQFSQYQVTKSQSQVIKPSTHVIQKQTPTDQRGEDLAVGDNQSQKPNETETFTPGAPRLRTTSIALSHYIHEIITVPSSKVGLVIGRGGTKIREIRQLSGAQLDIAKVSDAETPNIRNITVTGSPENVASAKEFINRIVSETPGDIRRTSRNGNRNPPDNPNKTIEIPSHSVGLVIGRRGDNIRKIIKRTGCIIHIEKEEEANLAGRPPPRVGFQTVYLKGSDDAVIKAEQEIVQMVNGNCNNQHQDRRPQKHLPYENVGHQQFIHQVHQPYRYPAYGSQQFFGFQQPYMVPGQSLMQPMPGTAYTVLPGYNQAYPSQTYIATQYNPGTPVGGVGQQIAYSQAPYTSQTVQAEFRSTVSPTGGVASVYQPQCNQTVQSRSFNLDEPQCIPQQQFCNLQLGSNDHLSLNGTESHSGSSRTYTPYGGEATVPSGLVNSEPSRFQRAGTPLFLPNAQFARNMNPTVPNGPCNPPRGRVNTQVPQIGGHLKGMQVYSQSPHSLPSNLQGRVTNAKKPQCDQVGGAPNLTAPAQNSALIKSDRISQ